MIPLWTSLEGSLSTDTYRALTLSALLAASVVAGAVALPGMSAAADGAPAPDPPASMAEESDGCSTAIGYDEFRTDEAIVDRLENGSNESVRKKLTEVTVGSDNGFYRVSARNPNSYCVTFDVQVHEDVFPPADLPGKVTSTNDEHVGNWTSVYDWDNETMYTRITFTLPGNSSATFAPSSPRVFSLSWAERKPKQSKSFLEEQYDRLMGNKTVAEKEHEIDASDDDREPPFNVVVPLKHPETGEPLEDQVLVYSTDDGESWRPVETRTSAPVYMATIENGSSIRLTFNDNDVLVKFFANPGRTDRFGLGYSTWKTGAMETLDGVIPGDYFSVTRKDARDTDEEGG